MTTALYRRYRPETFADVIGQEHVTEPLMQALRSGRINHAYLFSGPRGCGKTTSARILARCLNCEQGPTPEPCGTCESCVALARGGPGSVDVIEIDAASHGGVDDARDLRERASFGPANSRYKIYIIDEAHMVTPQGFNALLKIVEEPPEHVKFVFATTEPEKVIGTIRSRTHHYPFRLVPPKKLTDYMERLLEAEHVGAEPGVLSFVTRAGGGSVRDSLSVLDQLIAGSGPEGLTYEHASSLLGFTDEELLDGIVEAFAAGDSAAVFRQIDRVIESGADPRRFVEDLLERLRDLIVVAAVAEGAGAVLRAVPEDQLERMRQQAASFGAGGLSRAADVINTGLTEMTGATSPRLQLELMCARVLLPGIAGLDGYAARLDRMERRLDMGVLPAGSQPGPVRHAPSSGMTGGSAPTGAPEVNARADSQAMSAPAEKSDDAARSTSNDQRQPSGQGARDESARQAEALQGSRASEQNQAGQGQRQSSPQHSGERDAQQAVQQGGERNAQQSPQQGQRPAAQQPPQHSGDQGVQRSPQPSSRGGMTTDDVRRAWPDVLDRIFRIKRVTWTLLSQNAQVVEFDGQRLVLGATSAGLAQTMSRGQHPEVVRQALIEAIGVDVNVEARPMSPAEQTAGEGQAPRASNSATSGGSGDFGREPTQGFGSAPSQVNDGRSGDFGRGSAPAPNSSPSPRDEDAPPPDDAPYDDSYEHADSGGRPETQARQQGAYGSASGDSRQGAATRQASGVDGSGGTPTATSPSEQRNHGGGHPVPGGGQPPSRDAASSPGQPNYGGAQQQPQQSGGRRGGWRERTGWNSGDPSARPDNREAASPEQDAGLATAAAQSAAWGSNDTSDWAHQQGPAPDWADAPEPETTGGPAAESTNTAAPMGQEAEPDHAGLADEPTPDWMEDEPETDVEAVYDPLPPKQSPQDSAGQSPSEQSSSAPEQPSQDAAHPSPTRHLASVPDEPSQRLTPRQRAEKQAREAAQRQEDAGRNGGSRYNDDSVSPDDEDIENSDAIGLPVIKSVLGGTVISEEGPE